MTSLEITIDRPKDEIAVVRLNGKYTIEDVNDFKARTAPLMQAPVRHILLDCSKLKYIDSSGIGSLILLMNTAKNVGIGLIFYDVASDIVNVLRIAYLDKFFRISTSVDLGKSFPGVQL